MQREHVILVGPVSGGWTVQCDGGMQPLMFLSGALAEEHARALAQCLTRTGDDAEVVIQDRRHMLVGATRYRAASAA
jgi:hypothetical protein